MADLQRSSDDSEDSLDTLLVRWRNGDAHAAEEVLTRAYKELRRLAASHFRHERPGHTLQPTAIVHEVFLKLNNGRPIEWQDRAHFFAVFSINVRQVLLDHARRRKAKKRHDTAVAWPGARNEPALEFESLLTVHNLISELDALNPRAAEIVQLRVFGGLTVPEISDTLGISDFTVKKDWNFARVWLLARLRETGSKARPEK